MQGLQKGRGDDRWVGNVEDSGGDFRRWCIQGCMRHRRNSRHLMGTGNAALECWEKTQQRGVLFLRVCRSPGQLSHFQPPVQLHLFLPANLAPFLWLFLGMVTTSSCSSCGMDATFCKKIFSSVCAIRTMSSVGCRTHEYTHTGSISMVRYFPL